MKTIIYGRQRTIERLTGLLEDEGIEVKAIPESSDKNMDWLEGGEYDVAIIDSRTETAEPACHNIRKSGNTPIVLVVEPTESNWKRLLPLDADCYLPETRENAELAARLRAMLRRFSNKKQTAKGSGSTGGWIVGNGFAIKQNFSNSFKPV